MSPYLVKLEIKGEIINNQTMEVESPEFEIHISCSVLRYYNHRFAYEDHISRLGLGIR